VAAQRLRSPSRDIQDFKVYIITTQPAIVRMHSNLVQWYVGHVALSRHMTLMKIRTDPLCPECGEEEEIPYHLLGRFSAMMTACYSILGSHLMDIMEHQPQRDLYNLLLISGLCSGSKMITASALDSIAVLSTVKVRCVVHLWRLRNH